MGLNCLNHLDIFGDFKDLVDFYNKNRRESESKSKKLVNENVLTFSVAVPVKNEDDPKECKKKWGTKQNAVINDWENDIEEETDQIYYIFETLKNPPNLWLKEVAKKYPKLEFNLVYQNTENDISGEIIYRKGRLYSSVQNNHSDEIWNYIGDDLMLELKNYISDKTDFKNNDEIIDEIKNNESNIYKNLKKIIINFDENGKYIVEKAMDSLIIDYENDINEQMKS